MADLIDRPTIYQFMQFLHDRAASALNGARGVLHLCVQTPDERAMSTQAFNVGDVDGMVEAAAIGAEAGRNVYVEARVTKPGLPKERGKAFATVGVFAFVIDRDADTNRAGRLNGSASAVVETSPGNCHEWLFLTCALSAETAKPIGDAIRKGSGADACTGVITQPYRVPGTPNYPDSKKIARGRMTVLTRLISITDKVWTADELIAVFPPIVAKKPRAAKTQRASPEAPKSTLVKLKVSRRVTAKTDRSRLFQAAVAAAVRAGMTPDDLEALMRKHPEGCASKYLENGDRLRAEIDRSWNKIDQDETPAPIATPQYPKCTLAHVHAVFRKWFGPEFDIDTIDAVIAAAAAERLAGDPLWLLVVSGPGNAKTETVESLSGAGALITSTVASEGALLSALPPSNPNATGGLLRKIGDRGILVIKDVTSILSADRNTRAGVLAALREVYDGRWERNVGIGGGQSMGWTGRITVVGAVTSAWDVAHSVVTVMGDRFVLIRSNSNVGRTRSGIQAIRNTGGETAMRQEIPQSAESLATSIPTPTSSAITRLSGW